MSTTFQIFPASFQKLSRWGVFFSLWTILISIAIGRSGIANYLELVELREQLHDNNMQLFLENQFMMEKIELLQKSKDYQVRYIKENFGLLEDGEYVYQFSIPNFNIYPKSAPQGETIVSQAPRQKPL